MTDEVSTVDDEFIIKRKGKPLATSVPVERLEQMRRLARRHALEFMEQQTPSPLSDDRAAELAAEGNDGRSERPASKRLTRFSQRAAEERSLK